jgi:hypothetical protein
VRRVAFVILWTVGVLFGTCFLVGVVSGVWLMILVYAGKHPTSEVAYRLNDQLLWVPLVTMPVAFILGVFGLLPGTRRRKSSQEGKRETVKNES